MSETSVPAAEAEVVENEREPVSYELAFHVLPTVAEGEVPAVFESIKTTITNVGGELLIEEAPAHLELAYEIEKYLEGRNRRFATAYFGWVRFRVAPSAIATITAEVEGQKEVLRYLLVKLTRTEEENPFYFHEARAEKRVETVDETPVDPESAPTEEQPAPAAEGSDTSEAPAAEAASAAASDEEPAADDSEAEPKTV